MISSATRRRGALAGICSDVLLMSTAVQAQRNQAQAPAQPPPKPAAPPPAPTGPQVNLGDLPNLVVDAHGHGRLNARTDRVTLTDGPATLFDLDGSAFIIHADVDDQVTDVGNGGSGARIACAVIEHSR